MRWREHAHETGGETCALMRSESPLMSESPPSKYGAASERPAPSSPEQLLLGVDKPAAHVQQSRSTSRAGLCAPYSKGHALWGAFSRASTNLGLAVVGVLLIAGLVAAGYAGRTLYASSRDANHRVQEPTARIRTNDISGGDAKSSSCSTCSVVFPSKTFDGKGLGGQIDGADCVVRYNYHDPQCLGTEETYCPSPADYGQRLEVLVLNQEDNTLSQVDGSPCVSAPPDQGGCRRVAFTSYQVNVQDFMNRHPDVEVMGTDVADAAVGAMQEFEVREKLIVNTVTEFRLPDALRPRKPTSRKIFLKKSNAQK